MLSWCCQTDMVTTGSESRCAPSTHVLSDARGQPEAIRYRIDALDRALEEVAEKALWIAAHPVGENYNLSPRPNIGRVSARFRHTGGAISDQFTFGDLIQSPRSRVNDRKGEHTIAHRQR